MICQKCSKNSATVFVTKVVNGKKTEMYFCEHCAMEKGEMENPFEENFPLHQFFSGMIGLVPGGGSETIMPQTQTGVQCGSCGLTYAQFGQIGRFGCDGCYDAFGEHLSALFRRLHGNQKHMGKIPVRTGSGIKLKREIEKLREQLQKKIAEEAFEEAAHIRDQIKELEKRKEAGGDAGE